MSSLAHLPAAIEPPLFARLWSRDGAYRCLLAEPNEPAALNPALDWHCEVVSPGGQRAEGPLKWPKEDRGDGWFHRAALSIFEVPDPTSLWLSPIRDPNSSEKLAQLKEIGLAAWDVAGRGEIADFEVHEAGRPWLTVSSNIPIGFIEATDTDGRPAFAAWRPGDRLAFDFDATAKVQPLVPRVFSSLGLHTAFWGFLRVHQSDAAQLVAESLLRELGADRSLPDETVLASAHAILRFRSLWEKRDLVAGKLSALPRSIDASIMMWLLDLEREGSPEEMAKRFLDILGKLQTERVALIETFRLFYGSLEAGVALVRTSTAIEASLDKELHFVRQLAAASSWGGERLVYRGSSPLDPDRKAVETTGLKKNFADKVRPSIAGRISRPAPSKPVPEQPVPIRSAASIPPSSNRIETPRELRPFVPPVRAIPQQDFRVPMRTAAAAVRPRPQRVFEDAEFVDRLVHINRVAKVVKGGRRFGFAVVVVVGDQKGRVGYGHGKAREVPEAIRKATEAAKRDVIHVSLREGRTLHHDVKGRHGAGKVVLRAAPAGTGIIAGGPMRAIFEVLGINDVVAKSLGSSNPANMIRATFDALNRSESPRQVARRRGLNLKAVTEAQASLNQAAFASSPDLFREHPHP